MDENNDRPTTVTNEASASMYESRKISTKKFYFTKIFSTALLVLLGYGFAYMQWSVIPLLLGVASLVWLENRDASISEKIQFRAETCSISKKDLIGKIHEIPAWVKFPDRERAEWLNKIIEQLWPTINNYVVKLFRGSIQGKIRKKFESFRFEDVDFGCNPPKIDGVKVYTCATTKDSIIVDFDVFYDGNCDINFSMSGAQFGSVRDFQLSVEVRVVLKPLLLKMPLIGGIQIFFLNIPDITFDLEGFSKIPVFPNKITKRFSKSVEPSELKALQPAGVLRVHVTEARNLMAKDLNGKSDPYVILHVGAQERRTKHINYTLNPKWDYWCEFVIIDPMAQHLNFEVFDYDRANEDDHLGSGDVDISSIVKGETDQWLKLNEASHGEIHLRFTWLSLSSDKNALAAAIEESKLLKVNEISTAILTVFVDSAVNLPMIKPNVRPHPFFTLMVRNTVEKSKIKKHTVDPEWEQGFVFLVPNPENDTFYMNIIDKRSDTTLAEFSYPIVQLIDTPNMEISKNDFILPNDETKIRLSLQLRFLSNESFEDGESESDSDENISKPSSITCSQSSLSVEERIPKSTTSPELQSMLVRSESVSSTGEFRLGKIELTIAYNESRQKLVITVHRISNLPVKDPSDIPDPYVKIRITSNGSDNDHVKFKTKVKKDSSDPIYEETFEHLFSKSDVYNQIVTLSVKSGKFIGSTTIGQVIITMKYFDLSTPCKRWYDLCPKQTYN